MSKIEKLKNKYADRIVDIYYSNKEYVIIPKRGWTIPKPTITLWGAERSILKSRKWR